MNACGCLDPGVWGHACPGLAHPARVAAERKIALRRDLPGLHDPAPRPEPFTEPDDGWAVSYRRRATGGAS